MVSPHPNFRCCLVGSAGLTVQCGQAIVDRGGTLASVVTDHPPLLAWAAARNIACYRTVDEARAAHSPGPVEYLFSVVNAALLPAEVLQWPTRLAINYHNGPLPRYAGVHATSWAILNGEPEHGIVWHVMEPRVDAGPVLRRASFPIGPRDTTFDLNLRCHEAALAEFEQLLDDLIAGGAPFFPQQQAERTYFRKHQKDVDGGILRWDASAEQIDRVVRAHTLGALTSNAFGLPKFLVPNGFFVPTDLEVTQSPSTRPPGTIVAMSGGAIVVATATRDVRITRLSSPDGTAGTASDVLERLGFRSDDRLPVPTSDEAARVAAALASASRDEAFCVDAISAAVPTEPPYASPDSSSETTSCIRAIDADGSEGGGISRLDIARLAVFAWLGRSAAGPISVRYSTDELADRADSATLSATLPFTIELHPRESARHNAAAIGAACAQIERRGIHAADLRLRYKLPDDALSIALHIGEGAGTTPAPLSITLSRDAARLRLTSMQTAERPAYAAADLAVIAGQIDDALLAIAARPDDPIATLELTSAADRERIRDFAGPVESAPQEPVTRRWTAQMRATPDAVALSMDGESLTYRALDAQAEALADRLSARGVVVGTLVGVCVDRSFDMVAAILGVLKAGGVYVPLAAELPAARLDGMIRDAGLHHVVAHDRHAPLLESRIAQVIRIGAAELAPPRPPISIGASDPAYVNFTSGSTGVPKGVLVSHGGIVRLADAPETWSADSRVVLQAAPLSFDAATLEIWCALLNGATLVLLPPGPPTTTALAAALLRHRVDTLFLTTTLFNQMVDEALPAFAHAHHVMTGGETMSPAHARRFLDAHPRCRLANVYGPTENTSISTTFVVPRDLDAALPVSIGRPIRHSQAYVLDASRRTVPVGIAGELYVAGAGLAIGYLNRPDLTADRFVVIDGRRMYRTGDLARWNTDGTLHFLGRADRQVKVRGHRIEPAEIEAAINDQPGVNASAVVARDDAPGGRGLVAYVVAQGGARVDTAALRRAIATRLPEYMVPGAWVVLPALPVSPTGKLDVAALPAPAADVDAAGRQPQTPLERTLCELFARALSRERVGLDDDFFSLGGHSLRAAELASRVRDTLGVELSLRLIFEHPTVADLLAHLPATATNTRPLLERRHRPDPMPLSPAQRRMWFLQQLDGPAAAYNIRLAYRLDGEVDVDALRAALADLSARHESLRTTFPARDGVAYQCVLEADLGSPALAVEPCTESELSEWLRAAAGVAIDVSTHTPLRATLLTIAPDRHVLLLVLHHIAGDGGSLRPLWDDLSRAYEARRCGVAPKFVPLPFDYADYTLWQRALLGDASREPSSLAARQLRYWRGALAGIPHAPTLRTDFPRPATPGGRGAAVAVQIDTSLHVRLLRAARDAGATPFMVLHAALAAALARELAAGDDVVIGTPVAGRAERGLEDQIGFYANTLALRVRLDDCGTFRELIGRARSAALDAYANQDVPFDEVVGALLASRSSTHHPLFQVMFALDNTPPPRPAFAGVTVRPEPLGATSAKFDLLLALTERADAGGGPAGIDGEFEYDAGLFAPETIRRLAARWTRLLDVALSDPDRPMSELRLEAPADTAMTLPELLAAAPHAGGPALLASDREPLSHPALATLLAALSSELSALGVGRGDRVAIVLPNGPAMAVTFLAVASVAAAAPLNPAYRAAEFEFFLDDLNARALIVADGATGPAIDVARARRLPIVRIADADGGWHFTGDRVGAPRGTVEPPLPSDVALLLHTSGTTARPKLVPLSHENLCQSARNVARSLALVPGDVCLNVMPLFHIHGLVAALLASLGAGAAVICSEGFDATKVLPWLRRFRPTWYTAVPTMHAAILDRARGDADVRTMDSLRLIRSSSSALPPTVALGLEQVFGVPMIEAYGMTEAAHQMCCNPLPPLPRKPGSVGLPAGPEVAIMDAVGGLLPRGASGEIVIRGRNVTAGYAANDKANAEAFTAGWFRTGDLGHVDADGYLFLSGRSKEIINRGGEKISPREIDEALLAHPAIAAAVAFAMPDLRLGEEVAAAVVLRAGQTLTEREVMLIAAATLADFKVPRRVLFLDELPKGATGKVQRVGLAKQLGLAGIEPSPPASDRVAPRNEIERRLAAIWLEVLGRADVGIHDRFVDVGGDSVLAAQVVARVRDSGLGDLPIVAFFDRPTIATMADTIAAAAVNASLPMADEDNLESLLAEIEGMSDEEAERLLAKERARDEGRA